MKNYLVILLIAILPSCQTSKRKSNINDLSSTIIKTYYIAPVKVPCEGVGPMTCLLVKTKMENPWQYFYQSIKGFEHLWGQTYIIKVKETKIDNPPADSSSLNYELVEILEQRQVEQDFNMLYDIYGIIKVNNTLTKNTPQTLELNTTKMTFMGQAACNYYNGKLKKTNDWNGITFSQIISTEMYCKNQKTEDAYLKALQSATSYYKFNNSLLLFKDKEVVIEARRID
ncbi:DUF4377 domain-containing protein [Carboxylicivirga linearis]|uniref:DUF4377 domain-containing protein n=1 Tax=Carboxylicivirga linearis TaxID=1628157 RepID=A0ABS5JUD3_9BACT|nr:DUF4377 domain-containing protein [Carboxylicivirga linearis]MBS2098523.1 DUF4377 domain-containing protein [Carboxylicivirga linearis]